MPNTLRVLMLGFCAAMAPLALAPRANAAEPTASVILYDAAGDPVGTLTVIQAGSAQMAPPLWNTIGQDGLPGADPFAQMDAMMDAMMARMDSVIAGSLQAGPDGVMTIATPQDGAGQMFVSIFSASGRGSCGETVTYRTDETGPRPEVIVHQVGNSCGTPPALTTRATPAALPDEHRQPALQTDPNAQLYKIDFRHRMPRRHTLHG